MKRFVQLTALFLLIYSNLAYAKLTCPEPRNVPFALEAADVTATVPLRTELDQNITPHTYDVWMDMFSQAKETIDIGQFYLDDKKDMALEPVLDEIVKAAGRGVKVRVLVDKKFAKKSWPTVNWLKEVEGVEIRWFDWSALTGGIIHAKYFIVDGHDTFVGSHNFAWRALVYNHETGLRIKSSAFAAALGYIFELDWLYAEGRKDIYECAQINRPFEFDQSFFMVASPPSLVPQGVYDSIVILEDLINFAQESITIQLYRYSLKGYSGEDFTTIDSALRRAAARGVKIRMILDISAKKKPDIDFIKDLDSHPNIEIKFVVIPKDKTSQASYARLTHSKVMRIDGDISWIGTSNWSHDYFWSSRNIEVVSQLANIASTLDALLEDVWASEYAVPLKSRFLTSAAYDDELPLEQCTVH